VTFQLADGRLSSQPRLRIGPSFHRARPLEPPEIRGNSSFRRRITQQFTSFTSFYMSPTHANHPRKSQGPRGLRTTDQMSSIKAAPCTDSTTPDLKTTRTSRSVCQCLRNRVLPCTENVVIGAERGYSCLVKGWETDTETGRRPHDINILFSYSMTLEV